MPGIVWDKVGDRVYETGLDKGVLYLPDGSAVPWNGLTSIIDLHSIVINWRRIFVKLFNDLVVLGDIAASMKAVTYPDEFVELEGLASPRKGMFFGDQRPQTFGLCYRTQIGNDLEGDLAGYKIHIIYNVTAIPREKAYASVTASPSLVEFEWDITAVPEEVPGFRPTAHIILDSRDFDPWLLQELEDMLYGKVLASAILIPMPDLITYINEWYRVKIIDNGDGTWTAIADRDGFISIDVAERLFTIIQINATYLDDVTFIISDTVDIADVPQIKVTDNGDGTWTAETGNDNLIIITNGYEFEIRNANADYLSSSLYRITDTTDMD